MIGFRSGHLIVVAPAPTIDKRAMWKCACDCGGKIIAMGKYLRRKEVKSCGCLRRRPFLVSQKTKHGHAAASGPSRTYKSWHSMMQRCTNPNCAIWHVYGGNGITVCKRWRDFKNFLADMGKRPADTSLDRINGRRGYTPSNCRWATRLQQAQNIKTVRLITFNKQTKCLSEWARFLDISTPALHHRLKRMPLRMAMRYGPIK